MQLLRPADLDAIERAHLPTEDDLPCSDGVPRETPRHRQQMNLLIETLELHWAERDDFYTGGDMFLYFSEEQIRGRDFRGPDFYVVLGVPRRERKSWVVWQEDGKGPNLIVELLSESTAAIDKGEKKQVYQDALKVPEYLWYDPFSAELAGFRLRSGVYEPIEPDDAGRLPSQETGLSLVRWYGRFRDVDAVWLRWVGPDGLLLPTDAEISAQAQLHADQAQLRADQAELRAGQAELRADRAELRVEREQLRAERAEQRIVALEAELRRAREAE